MWNHCCSISFVEYRTCVLSLVIIVHVLFNKMYYYFYYFYDFLKLLHFSIVYYHSYYLFLQTHMKRNVFFHINILESLGWLFFRWEILGWRFFRWEILGWRFFRWRLGVTILQVILYEYFIPFHRYIWGILVWPLKIPLIFYIVCLAGLGQRPEKGSHISPSHSFIQDDE